jgi:hypothetical protein
MAGGRPTVINRSEAFWSRIISSSGIKSITAPLVCTVTKNYL